MVLKQGSAQKKRKDFEGKETNLKDMSPAAKKRLHMNMWVSQTLQS